ncbi:alpha/beta hydrolase family protein [Elusimicrobiota bacterium]
MKIFKILLIFTAIAGVISIVLLYESGINTGLLFLSDKYMDAEDIAGFPEYMSIPQVFGEHRHRVSKKKLLKKLMEAAISRTQLKAGTRKKLKEIILKELNIGFLVEGLSEHRYEAEQVSEVAGGGYLERHVVLHDVYVGDVDLLLLVPDELAGKNPVVIGLHGHKETGTDVRDSYGAGALANNGFIVALPGFRAMGFDLIEASVSWYLMQNGFSLLGLRVYEVLLVIDYLKSLEYVDSVKIGLIGHSGGAAVGNLTVRITSDIQAQVTDNYKKMLSTMVFYPQTEMVHCATLPGLSYYAQEISDSETLDFPVYKLPYGMYGYESNIIKFFKTALMQEGYAGKNIQ